MTVKKRVYEILEGYSSDRPTEITNGVIVSLIGVSVAAFTLGTVDTLYRSAGRLFDLIETVSVLLFTVEYLLRLWSCTSEKRYSASISGRLRFARSPFLLIDLAAILPSYLPFLGANLLFLRAVRLNRLFRAVKLGRYSTALQTFGRVVAAKRYDLLTSFVVISMGLFMVSSFEYLAEHDAQPETFSSIPAALWWGIGTITTAGYGDVVPKTSAGKIIGSVGSLLGIVCFALPAGIFAGGFVEEFQRRQRETKSVCQHCGRPLG